MSVLGFVSSRYILDKHLLNPNTKAVTVKILKEEKIQIWGLNCDVVHF